MTGNLSPSAPPVLQEYYRVLTAGPEAFGDGRDLRGLLSGRLDFTGSLAGHLPDATEHFLQGVTGFIGTVRGIDFISDVHDNAGSAVLYDADMPGGTVRFAEFFTFGDGVISTLNLHYDGPDYIAKGGR
ncbi:hypothetical protein QNO08_05800 [Arthrobacter sp. zg-Y820]|uniref:hypothetical protein n=1 Tax=unclassified Arthrobacter TaxID=235627 RepID=UPI001E5AF96C|nr:MULTISPECIES: hypothetical protein [unclassified Arthrobacter]MCC9198224.1 hypothetical protein [Arthrobacter sp. zg-Y820]MDK1281093.1 hypothetical protein [Arthrobacter sp. zg.Y820]MDK1360409.1 hypothetical protein [Arthrobacter sp. zg-Y1219]WIB10551.1 hypothetical protein QNO08_05800 [Arthrobacter sp. zg-Y820]